MPKGVYPHKHHWPLLAPEIRAAYASGLSSRQVASLFGCGNGTVKRLCADIIRDMSTAAILRQPAKSLHWRSCRAQARKLTERELGRKLLPTEVVHHKNGDFTDQRKENREVMLRKDHCRLHKPEEARWGRKDLTEPSGSVIL
jgi:hypothetical protein